MANVHEVCYKAKTSISPTSQHKKCRKYIVKFKRKKISSKCRIQNSS